MRIYPHLQDSGGFFVAVIEREHSQKSQWQQPSAIDSALLHEVRVTASGGQTEAEDGETRIAVNTEVPVAGEGEPPSKRQKLDSPPAVDEGLKEENNARLDSYFKDREEEEASVREVVAASSEGIIGVRGEIGETGGQFKEDPYTFVDPQNELLSACLWVIYRYHSSKTYKRLTFVYNSDKLSLASSFPRSNLFVRNPDGSPVRGVYLVNDAVKAVMDATDYRRMRLVSAGVKLFGRSELGTSSKYVSNSAAAPDSSEPNMQMVDGAEDPGEGSKKKTKKMEFRVLNEGLLALLPYLDVSKLTVGNPGALRVFLESYYPLCAAFDVEMKDFFNDLGATSSCSKQTLFDPFTFCCSAW